MMLSNRHSAVPRRRVYLHVLLVFVLFATLALSAGAAVAQGTSVNSLGCWGHFTAGGDQRATTANRVRDQLTWVGGLSSSPNMQLLANGYALSIAWRPIGGGTPPAIVATTAQYLPFVGNGWNFLLNRMCS